MSKITGMTIIGAFSILTATTPAFAQQTADDKLNSFFKNYLEEYFRQQPLQATSLGDHRFDDQLDDISQKARDGWLTRARDAEGTDAAGGLQKAVARRPD